ncbi:chorismate mutase [Streptococcus varani]|uniref:Chorismate mutase n=1 Tax=Streptococcus varani TaxID=1608583 RepID=A0A0E4CSZ1_9STRE|nr:chorismate mutase [Streptococcus varani]CQR25179.1 chorismate mutase [Streptococcus varani]
MILNLDDIRQDIDCIDKKIVQLLEKRMDVVNQVVAYKKETGKAILDTSREAAVLDKVESLVKKPDYQASIRATFSDIMAQSRAYQEKILDLSDEKN